MKPFDCCSRVEKLLAATASAILLVAGLAAVPFGSVAADTSVRLRTALLTAPSDGDAGPRTPGSFINIQANLPGEGTIQFNRNSCGALNHFGDPSFCTLVYYRRIDVKFLQARMSDPADRGRRLYKISGDLPNPTWTYYLVEPACRCGAYRRVIDDGTTVAGPAGAKPSPRGA